MFPHGWNSAIPGRPVAAYVLRQHQRNPALSEEQHQRTISYAKEWVQRWKTAPDEALQDIRRQDKVCFGTQYTTCSPTIARKILP
jgi:hypothetical protein